MSTAQDKHPAVEKILKISEAHVQQTVVQFLELDGWRAIRTDPVSDRSRGKGFGELGMPDYLFIRYQPEKGHCVQFPFPLNQGQIAEVLWTEFKRKRGLRKDHQVRWHQAEAARGALVLTVDDIDEFTRWYKASGLCQRIL